MAAVLQYAAIDVGSYEIEMAIYEISQKHGIRKIDHIRHVMSLGRETYRYGKISVDMIDELCHVISGFVEVMKEYGIIHYRAYATSALREASNRQIVLDRIKVRTGVEVTVLSNSEQRLLFYKALACPGAAHGAAADKGNYFEELIQEGTAIVDVGFGSLQISLFDKGVLMTTQNVRLGALRIREMLSNIEGDSRSVNRLIEELVDNEISTFQKMFLQNVTVKHVIGIGNNILFSIRKAIGRSDMGDEISALAFNRFYQMMMTQSPNVLAQRLEIPDDYATLLLPGTMTYKRVLDMTDAEEIWAPPVSLCDGAAADYAERNHFISLRHDFTNDIIQNAYVISRRYLENERHAALLDHIVSEIYDNMKKYHGMGKREKLLLRIAAILHDCGKYISMSASGDCAYYIIMATEIIGLSQRESEIIANVVRFNTVEYAREYRPGSVLTDEDYKIILKLTAILRVANAMDRSHRQKFKNISFRQKEHELLITTTSAADISLERGLFSQKADFFEEVYGIRPVLKQKKGAI